MLSFKKLREQRTDTRLSDQTEDGGSGVKEESKFDLLREMGGEREQGRTPPLSPSHRRFASSLVPSGPDILLLHTKKDETSEPSASKGKNAVRGKRIRVDDDNLNYSPLSLTIRLEFQ